MRALVVGWFSFEEMGATAGDLLVRDVVCGWLDEAGCPYDLAVAPPFDGGVDWREPDPATYTHLVFACGPLGNGWPITELLPRFAGCRLVAVDVSMLQALEEWNPFDLLLERDSSRTVRPDVSFLSTAPLVPVVGVVLVHAQSEYEGGLQERVDAAIGELLAGRDVAVLPIDTRLDTDRPRLRSPAQVESLIARADAVVTTRLHGLVLALKNGVPAVVVDPIAGGAKVSRQAAVLGWPHVLAGETVSAESLGDALEACLRPEARDRARACASAARAGLDRVRIAFLDEVGVR